MNDDIILILERLYEHADGYRKKAFEKAIESLTTYPKRVEDEKEALTIPGIGAGIAKRISEIRTTGKLQEYEIIQHMYKDLDDAIKEFRRIHSVGPKNALKWYNLGYRKISDLPMVDTETFKLTETQKISIKYLAETEERIPRADITYFHSQLTDYCNQLQNHFKIQFEFCICGSYLRGLPTSGDIDVLVNLKGNDPQTIMNYILTFPMFRYSFACGLKKFEGLALINGKHRRVDIELCPSHEYPLCLSYFTGPYRFNQLMREQAARMGYRLNEQKLLDSQNNPIYIENEEHLFRILGVAYLTPEQRQSYA